METSQLKNKIKTILTCLTILSMAVNAPLVYAVDNADSLLEFNPQNMPIQQFPVNDTHSGKNGFFSLITIADNFLNFDSEKQDEILDEKTKQQNEFIEATQRFNQGNVAVAYDDYFKLIPKIKNDFALLVFAKSLYEIGLFSLADITLSKIKHQDELKVQIAELKKSYSPSFPLERSEEIYLAKAYSSIYFDNSAQETAFELNKKTNLIEKSDYANFLLSQALVENRQYQQALIYINNAIQKNPKNTNYQNYKVKILILSKKYKDALKLVENLEKSDDLSANFKNPLLIQKELILAYMAKKDDEKKFHLARMSYLEGNYYKTIKECSAILTFNKDAYQMLTLLANSQLHTNNIEEAKKNFQNSFQINKNYAPTLVGMGDTEFLGSNYLKALEYYKKALKIDGNDYATMLKISIIYKMDETKYAKNIKKLEKKMHDANKNPFMEYYTIASGIGKLNENLRHEYIRKTLSANPLYAKGWFELLGWQIESKKLAGANNFLYVISFANQANYFYYYCRALVDIAEGKKRDAVIALKRALSINPDFEAANQKLLEILPSDTEDI